MGNTTMRTGACEGGSAEKPPIALNYNPVPHRCIEEMGHTESSRSRRGILAFGVDILFSERDTFAIRRVLGW